MVRSGVAFVGGSEDDNSPGRKGTGRPRASGLPSTMCGIAGVFNFDPSKTAERPMLERMCRALVHRGPDDEGFFLSANVGLGVRLLRIIDVHGNPQPIFNEDGRIAVVFNGEIYNYRELRRLLQQKGHTFRTHGDTECIVHAYEEFGEDFLQHLNGMFAIAIWDGRQQRLLLARDRVGVKPLYVMEEDGTLTFASEIKALTAARGVPKAVDREAAAYFLRYGYVSAPATLFKNVRQLEPAHYLIVDSKGVRAHRYWTLPVGESIGYSEPEEAERIRTALNRAVTTQMVSDVPLGAFLSGGLDSSSLVHYMSRFTDGQVNTYAVGFSAYDRYHDELADARFMSDYVRTRHRELIVPTDVADLLPRLVFHLDQPLADSSFLVTYLVAKLARQTVTVAISGAGGDELFAGYRRYLAPNLDRYYGKVPSPLRGMVAGVAAYLPVDRGSSVRNYTRLAREFTRTHGAKAFDRYDQAVRLVPEDRLREFAPDLARTSGHLMEARRTWFETPSADDQLRQMQYLDFHTSLPDSLLLLTDKMTMATSVEARVPFLDHQLVELVTGMRSGLKVRGTNLRHIQKAAMSDVLPTRVLRKRKRGFGFPVGAWFRLGLKEMLLDLLSTRRLKERGLSPRGLQPILEAHLECRADYSDLLLALVTLELWQEGNVLQQA